MNINLCEILKGHEGEYFWNPLVGSIRYKSNDRNLIYFQYGTSVIDIPYHGKDIDGNMLVFPSKDKRDWEKWDKENNHKTPKTWSELKTTKGICIPILGCRADYGGTYDGTEKGTLIEKSALALLKIHQLIEVGYGGNVTKEEWKDDGWKFCIIHHTSESKFSIERCYRNKRHIAFHTKEQAEEFLKYEENIQLLKDYFMV